MRQGAKDGTCLALLVQMAVPLCQEAQRRVPRTGPGRKPIIPDWVIAVLIMMAIAKRKKTKSSQYRYLHAHQQHLKQWLGVDQFPARSTYFQRYRRAYVVLQVAIELQGRQAVQSRLADASIVAVDKSLIEALGPRWNKSDRQRGVVPKNLRGVDTDGEWTHTQSRGWVQGYSFEVVVSAGRGGVIFPLLATAGTAKACESQTFLPKIDQLPSATQEVLADSNYDTEAIQQRVEGGADQPTGRTLLCPVVARGKPPKGQRRPHVVSPLRKQRLKRMKTRTIKKRYARRSTTVEPFNEWFKSSFDLSGNVWHRGLDNNQTQLLAAIFVYQLLVRILNRYKPKNIRNGRIRRLLDEL